MGSSIGRKWWLLSQQPEFRSQAAHRGRGRGTWRERGWGTRGGPVGGGGPEAPPPAKSPPAPASLCLPAAPRQRLQGPPGVKPSPLRKAGVIACLPSQQNPVQEGRGWL